MAIAEQKQDLLKAVSSIRSAEQLLIQESRATADPAKLAQINAAYDQLDSFLSELLHMQAIADDAEFVNATAALKQQAAALQIEEDDIKKIVSNVGIAAKIVGYIAQAASIIAKL